MRTTNPAQIAAMNADHTILICLFEFTFGAQVLRFTNTETPITYAGHEYAAGQHIGAVSFARETSGEISGMKFTLSALDGSAFGLALQEDIQEAPVIAYSAFLDPATLQIVGQPIPEWTGVLDQASIDWSTLTVVYTAESELIDFERARPLYRTLDDHQRLQAGDLFYSHAATVSKSPIVLVGKEYFQS